MTITTWTRRVAAPLCLATLAGCSEERGGDPGAGQTPTLKEALSAQQGVAKPTGNAEELAKRAEEFAAKGDYAQALAKIEEAIVIEPRNRKRLLLAAKYAHGRYSQVAGKDLKQAYILGRKSADYLRSILFYYPELTAEEKQVAPEFYITDATELASIKQDYYLSGAFQDAVGAGFRDFDRLRADPRWKEVLKWPSFKKEFEEAAKNSGKPAAVGATGSQGTKPAETKGTKPAETKGTKPAETKGSGSAGPP